MIVSKNTIKDKRLPVFTQNILFAYSILLRHYQNLFAYYYVTVRESYYYQDLFAYYYVTVPETETVGLN